MAWNQSYHGVHSVVVPLQTDHDGKLKEDRPMQRGCRMMQRDVWQSVVVTSVPFVCLVAMVHLPITSVGVLRRLLQQLRTCTRCFLQCAVSTEQ